MSEDRHNSMPKSPFFIIGCGRSGNTLLRSMLNQHPHIAIPLESLFIIDYLHADPTIPITKVKKLLVKEHEIKEWKLQISVEDFKGCQTPVDLINRVHELYMKKHQKTIWGQKTPRFIRYADELKRIYPWAKFIHIIRDPRAVVNSLIESDAHYSNAYYGAMRWLSDVNLGLKLKLRYPDSILEVNYENLVTNPKELLQKICDFLEVAFIEEMLNYYKNNRMEFTKKYFHKMVKNIDKPPDRSRIEAWQKKLSSKQITLIETICAETMQKLGYQLENQDIAISSAYITLTRMQRIIGISRQLLHYLLTRPGYLLCNLQRKISLGVLFQDFSKINS
jgi:hypothetical protein